MEATLSAAHQEGVIGGKCNVYKDAGVRPGRQKEREGNASGGCPSGATVRKRGLKLDDGGRKSALRRSTSAITIANTITIGEGLSNSI
jgi:hypothetical protein